MNYKYLFLLLSFLLILIACIESTPNLPPNLPFKDDEAPSTPTNLELEQYENGYVKLSWTISNDNVGVVGYTILRDGNKIGETANNQFVDSTAKYWQALIYQVSAYDSAGNNSENSEPVTITLTIKIADVSGFWKGALTMIKPANFGFENDSIKITIFANNFVSGALIRGYIAAQSDLNPDAYNVAGWYPEVEGEWTGRELRLVVKPIHDQWGRGIDSGKVTLYFDELNESWGEYELFGKIRLDGGGTSAAFGSGECVLFKQ